MTRPQRPEAHAVTLTDLRKTAPTGAKIQEFQYDYAPCDWRIDVYIDKTSRGTIVVIVDPNRQACRRAALAALKEIKKGESRG